MEIDGDGQLSGELLDLALRHQLQSLELWRTLGDQVSGWKVGFTSGNIRRHLPNDYRPFGYILQGRTFDSGTMLTRDQITAPQIEPELCFEIGVPLNGTSVSVAEVKAAIAGIRPAFEINELRRVSSHVPLPILVADNLNGWGLVIGEAIEPTSVLPRLGDLTVRVWRDATLLRTARRDAMDDHLQSLMRLCHRLAEFNTGLEVGHHVITGSFGRFRIDSSGEWRAEFPQIGSLSVAFE